jgi:hypothetical protein
LIKKTSSPVFNNERVLLQKIIIPTEETIHIDTVSKKDSDLQTDTSVDEEFKDDQDVQDLIKIMHDKQDVDKRFLSKHAYHSST